MCGLVGMAGQIDTKMEKMFKDMLVVDQLRGKDSTGILSVGMNFIEVEKSACPAVDFLERKRVSNILNRKSMLLMGHNRWATVGGVKSSNAHPFEAGTIIGMHNGTLKNWRTALDDDNDFNTDSECLYHNIAKNGLKPTIKKVDGAYALTWYDENDNTLNFLRNNDRPFSFQWSEDGRSIFWASEPWMIRVCADRNGVKLADKAYTPNPHKHFQFPLPENLQQGVGKATTRKIPHYEPPMYPKQTARSQNSKPNRWLRWAKRSQTSRPATPCASAIR